MRHYQGCMKIRIMGGASEAGSLSVYLEDRGMRLMFDNGRTPSRPPKYPMRAPPVDIGFLSHAHIDHSGMIPWLCREYDIDVIATPPTVSVGYMLLEDTVKVSSSEGYPVPYEKSDVRAMRRHFQLANFDDCIDVGDIDVYLRFAGHIPGASMFEVNGDKFDQRLAPRCFTCLIDKKIRDSWTGAAPPHLFKVSKLNRKVVLV